VARIRPGVASRLILGSVLPNSPENMVRWLRNPQEMTPFTAMPDLGVTEGEARDIAAYLATLH
jgi:cytochrome c1